MPSAAPLSRLLFLGSAVVVLVLAVLYGSGRSLDEMSRVLISRLPASVRGNVYLSSLLPSSATILDLHKTRSSIAATASRAYSTPSASGSSSRRFTYQFASSFSAKGTQYKPVKDTYHFSPFTSALAIHDEQGSAAARALRFASGQDAFFITPIGQNDVDGEGGGMAFGVADGVGGWVESGVDPADFAHGLCAYMRGAALSWPEGFNDTGISERAGEEIFNPRELLTLGYDRLLKDTSVDAGGSTACIATATKRGTLRVANLGDSGFVMLRPTIAKPGSRSGVFFASPAQTHAFNTPYQLSKVPEAVARQEAIFGVSRLADGPAKAAMTQHDLEHGDVLIFGTDGVWDNMTPAEALEIATVEMFKKGAWLSGEVGSGEPITVGDALGELVRFNPESSQAKKKSIAQEVAVAIAGNAKQWSLDKKRDGPFAREVHKHFPGERWSGGKMDDIAVVVAVVAEDLD